MGKINWWMPSWLDRIVPHISIEGAEFFKRRERPVPGKHEPELVQRCVSATEGALVERERELVLLRDGVGRAGAGDGSLLLIEGPAGVGKTELGREARAAAERAGITTLTARGSELEQPFAFGVVRQLLEPAITEKPERAHAFRGAASPAARLFTPDEHLSPTEQVDFEALHSLYWLIVNLTDDGPLLVLVDDCQWADSDSLRFVSYLALSGSRGSRLRWSSRAVLPIRRCPTRGPCGHS